MSNGERIQGTLRGVYDEPIAWLKDLERHLTAWVNGGHVNGAILCLSREYAVGTDIEHPAIYWDRATTDDKARTMHWIQCREAAHDLTANMERWLQTDKSYMQEHIQHVKAAIRWFEQNNRERRSKWD